MIGHSHDSERGGGRYSEFLPGQPSLPWLPEGTLSPTSHNFDVRVEGEVTWNVKSS